MNHFPAISLAMVLLAQAGQPPAPPPLSEEQIARLRALVQSTQESTASLQAQLEQKQRELAEIYAQYELNQRHARKLQEEIMQIQRQLLDSHHRMQVELRNIVSKERFEVIRLRLARALPPPLSKDAESQRPPK